MTYQLWIGPLSLIRDRINRFLRNTLDINGSTTIWSSFVGSKPFFFAADMARIKASKNKSINTNLCMMITLNCEGRKYRCNNGSLHVWNISHFYIFVVRDRRKRTNHVRGNAIERKKSRIVTKIHNVFEAFWLNDIKQMDMTKWSLLMSFSSCLLFSQAW